ncbi:phage tail protein [Citrobacter amalonaticus]|uniref:Phage tail fiber protein n=1 Tax=Citrobacter amalonaticus TaxID=35703 RepID=A0AAW9LYJ4_CITAM|nr:phage tail protein [Citrobacter amalonaticus]ELR9582427.1 phage tail protein [Citrobacter amalonaticus]MDV2135984.1 phage tail protein [Citrobacter amalonaticus]MEB0583490.1 phage tail protein [Citrobacter amalonaticus]SAZ72553.1 putative phage tail fiber protein [Citrobacter amalonaticus]SAZ77126.1 putative phage tail fiber protein [Citrobacter amalonaticus]
MSAKFYTLLTDIGAAKLASAAALGVPLKITQMAVGDGGGVLPTPSAQQTALVAEKRRAALNLLYIDPQNSSQIIAEQVIPETEGGWWIREVGLFDETGALIAVGNCPESYKPQLAEGSGRTQTVRMVLITSSTDNITLKIDPAVVLATRKYVDDRVLELKVYVDDLMAKHIAANDPHAQYAPKASPTFTGTPKAPTAAAGNNSTQLANTAFVQAAIAALVTSSPAALDTLNELAEALGNDPNFATTMTNALAGKMDKAANGKDIADVSEFLKNLGLGAGAPPIGIPFFWPSAAMPNTVMPEWSNMVFLKPNGASFSATEYPKLARIWTGLVIPDMRGDFPRIWDDGRGVDGGRALLSAQGDAIRNITGTVNGVMTNATTQDIVDTFVTGAFKGIIRPNAVAVTSAGYRYDAIFDASTVVPTAGENRSRNIALNFLVRAK